MDSRIFKLHERDISELNTSDLICLFCTIIALLFASTAVFGFRHVLSRCEESTSRPPLNAAGSKLAVMDINYPVKKTHTCRCSTWSRVLL